MQLSTLTLIMLIISVAVGLYMVLTIISQYVKFIGSCIIAHAEYHKTGSHRVKCHVDITLPLVVIIVIISAWLIYLN